MTAPQTDAPTWHQIEVAALVNVISDMEAKAKEAADALDAREATIAALVEALEAATDKQWVANATIEQCTLVDAALARAASLK